MKQQTESRPREARRRGGQAPVAVALKSGFGLGERDPKSDPKNDPMWSVHVLRSALMEFFQLAQRTEGGPNPRRKGAGLASREAD